MAVYNNKLFFRAGSWHPPYGEELWVYDDTQPAPTMVADFWAGQNGGFESWEINQADGSMVVYNNKLYFGASDGSKGHELYAYNGTTISIIHDVVYGTRDKRLSGLSGVSGAPVLTSTRHRTDNICTT